MSRHQETLTDKRAELLVVAAEMSDLQSRMNEDGYTANREDFMYLKFLELHQEALEKQIVYSRYIAAKAQREV